MCIWGAEPQMWTDMMCITCHCEIIPNLALNSIPPSFPKVPLGPFTGRERPFPHHLSWSADGQGSLMTKKELGLLPGAPLTWVGASSSLSCPSGALLLLPLLAVGCHAEIPTHMERGWCWCLLVRGQPPAAKGPSSWASEGPSAGAGLHSSLKDAGVNLLAVISGSIQGCENSRLRLLLLIEYNTEIIHP